jgi:hypothetical protein
MDLFSLLFGKRKPPARDPLDDLPAMYGGDGTSAESPVVLN